ncbi:OLC1v1038401C1 [Oldenlandia corymbosa var. corymbosa]|uniref:OLC1v1038401C1 n=1 Tax=Oldenlandia corymbosa var. corymbosa TaxID=529605 RepID=A0AAV1D3G1_OLDCO|nr:OLC1v1038401C1 [Oldenlandia corymbosa var. corymbosa]
MDSSWNSSGTVNILISYMLLFATCFCSVANSTIPPKVQQIAQESASALGQVESSIQNAAGSLLMAGEEKAFLAAHNKARLHAGEPPLVWDAKLAAYARQYAQQRSVDCNMVHSKGPYGENIFWGGGSQWTANDAVAMWIREHRSYDRASMKCEAGKMCGHYTQVVWRDTVRLGCAISRCVSGDTFAVCSYDPPGNYVGENPFA